MIYNHTPLAGEPTHLGEILREEIQARDTSLAAVSQASGIDYQTLEDIVFERKGVNATVAHGLEKALGIERDFWLNIQDQYDTDIAYQEERKKDRILASIGKRISDFFGNRHEHGSVSPSLPPLA